MRKKKQSILAECISGILGREIGWFDYKKQSTGSWQEYFNDAQYIISNETFNNELEHFKAELVKACAMMDGTPLETDRLIKLTNLQFGLVVLETLKERLESVEDPRAIKPEFDPHEEI